LIRVLTLSTLFPDASRPVFGPFVERQTLGIAAHPDIELRVVSPLGLPPWPLSKLERYRGLNGLPQAEVWKGLQVYRPHFSHLPGFQGRFDSGAITRILLPLLTAIRREFPFDLIDAEFFFPDGPAAIELGKHFGVPVSIKARGSDIHFWGDASATQRQIVGAGQAAQGLLAVSAALKRDMVAMGMSEERIRVHYTGVDLDRFKPLDRMKTKTALGINGPLIASVGGLIARKGQPLVIDALTSIPSATLALIGNGPDRDMLSAQVSECGLTDRVIFTGSLPQDEIATWVAAADVMALPSASEGLANAWVEALACGTPIVIADVGGARELLSEPEAGRFVARDAADVSAAISDLLANPPQQADVRAVVEDFTWARNTQTLYDHFRGLTDG
jgi:teichuronic acid biosynthesis glycosyltransferase TuaC